MGSAMTLSGSFFSPANSHGERVDGEHGEHSYRRVFAMYARTSRTMFANVRVRLKMFAYGECREKLSTNPKTMGRPIEFRSLRSTT